MTHPDGHLDSMCIPIRKVAEDDSTVTYRFESDYWTEDPERPKRSKVHAVYHGEILLDKESKECLVVTEMPFDKSKISAPALRRIGEHVKRGEYPDKTMCACG